MEINFTHVNITFQILQISSKGLKLDDIINMIDINGDEMQITFKSDNNYDDSMPEPMNHKISTCQK